MEVVEDVGICFGFDKKVREIISDDEMKEIVKELMKKRNMNGNKGLLNYYVNYVVIFQQCLLYKNFSKFLGFMQNIIRNNV